ncbi:MAG: MBL fold metallo-hydrolase [Thermoanaerobaculia bacterium]
MSGASLKRSVAGLAPVAAAVIWLLLAGAVGASGTAEKAPPVTVTYLANEGFLLAAGDDRVLVDALFPGIRHYARIEGETRARLLAARAPFDDIDVVLASHYHDDHFGPTEALAFLEASAASVLVSTPQALGRFQEVGGVGPSITERLHAVYPGEGSTETFESGPLSIEILNLHHGRKRRPPVQNLGFIIDLAGFRILHVGDTEADLGDFAPYELAARKIDLALLPGWFLAEPGWARVTRAIAPGVMVAMHLADPEAPASWFGSAGSSAKRKQRIRESFPGVWIPETALESRTFEATRGRP